MAAVQGATTAQKRFARELSLGRGPSKAYQVSHPDTKITGKALATTAHKAKKSQGVQEELARLMNDPILQPLVLSSCPEYTDEKRLREHAVGVMIRLSAHEDPIVAMHCAIWIYDYSCALGQAKAPKTPREDRSKILADLRGLYAKALKPLPVIVESTVEPAGPEASSESSFEPEVSP
jgi:hypothetical protein